MNNDSLTLLPLTALHLRFIPEPPAHGACVVCRRRQRTNMQCERCGAWMHWRCFVESVGDVRDLEGIDLAGAHVDDDDNPAYWRVLLCPGCRS